MLRSVVQSLQRNRSLLGAAPWVLVALALLAAPAAVTAFERVDAIELESSEFFLLSAVIDPAGAFAYFGTSNDPGRVVKIDLATFQRVDAIELPGEPSLQTAVIDPAGAFAYFGTSATPGQVVKIDLTTFQRVDAITMDSGENDLQSAVIDPAGDFAYFGANTFPGHVVKIDLATFQRVDAIELEINENGLRPAVIDPAGDFAYFGTLTGPARVVKIDLATFQRADAIELESGEDFLQSAVIDTAGDFAYFGTAASGEPGRVVKIGLTAFERVGAITLASGENGLQSAVIDPASDFAYFGTGNVSPPDFVVKIDLATFQRVDAIELESGEDGLWSAVIDPAGAFAYFSTNTIPGQVVKIGLTTAGDASAVAARASLSGTVLGIPITLLDLTLADVEVSQGDEDAESTETLLEIELPVIGTIPLVSASVVSSTASSDNSLGAEASSFLSDVSVGFGLVGLPEVLTLDAVRTSVLCPISGAPTAEVEPPLSVTLLGVPVDVVLGEDIEVDIGIAQAVLRIGETEETDDSAAATGLVLEVAVNILGLATVDLDMTLSESMCGPGVAE